MKCETCKKEFVNDWRVSPRGPARFCSRKCSCIRHVTNEQKQQISKKLKRREDKLCKECGRPLSISASSRESSSGFCRKCEAVSRRGTGKYGVEAKNWSAYVNAVRTQRKKEYVEIAGGKCIKCGYDKYCGALEFHHKDPSKKDFVISSSVRGLGKVKKELEKCILLCSNCHKELHEEIRQGRTLEEFLTNYLCINPLVR